MKKNGTQQQMKPRNDIDSMREGIQKTKKGKLINQKIIAKKVRALKVVLSSCTDQKIY